jgi:BioD-like phosphotransacetylase family protein
MTDSDPDAMDDAPARDDSEFTDGGDDTADVANADAAGDSSTDTLLVSATAESTGKTALTLALGLLAQDRGLDVAYMKPKGTRLESNVGKTLDTDPMLAREVLDLDAELHEMEPVVYSPTFVEGAIRGRERPADIHAEIRECYDRLAADADLVLVEGGGRYTTGGVVDLTDADVADLLDARTLVVGEYDRATDIDELLAAVADTTGGADADADADADAGDRLTGVVFNRVPESNYDEVDTDVAGFLGARGIDVRGVLPRVRELSGVTVAELAKELGAQRLTSDDGGDGGRADFVERFHVGAMTGDTALRHFRRTRDAAVITGGDRADVQTAAIEATGVTCLVLTGGIRPSGAVLGRAEEAGLPVLAVDVDTLTAVDRAEAVVSGGRTRDAYAVERMRDLLERYADVDTLLRGH